MVFVHFDENDHCLVDPAKLPSIISAECGPTMNQNVEQDRLAEHNAGKVDWKRWGTYLSDRAWGTVREDYSADGDAWNYFPHDHARSRVYRWNEDGIGGFCDDKQRICLAVAFWNENDPILK